MMITADYSFQNIDWWHGQISENEPFDHVGDLQTSMLNLRFSVGFNDYWDMTIEQPLIYRCMGWHVDNDSEHHRSAVLILILIAMERSKQRACLVMPNLNLDIYLQILAKV